MNLFIPAILNVSAPDRGGTPQPSRTLYAQSLNAAFAWGAAPGTAAIVYVGATGVTRGARVILTIGAHCFAGICQSDTASDSSSGQTRTLQFVDFREYLTWDWTFCAWNKLVWRTDAGGVRRKVYRQMYPAGALALVETYTDGPLSAGQIIAAVLGARVRGLPGGYDWGTIGTPWTFEERSYDVPPLNNILNAPVYDVDALGGKRLDAFLNEICGRLGVVFTLESTYIKGEPLNLYHLVFTRKGRGPLPAFPANSDERTLGEKLTGHATNVIVLGERNLYQTLDWELVPDWNRTWEAFLTVERLANHIFASEAFTDPLSGAHYHAIPSDPEQFVGRNRAMARALQITVRDFVLAMGDAWADYRTFSGRSRMDMPAALYIQTLLFRAFRPSGNGPGAGTQPYSLATRNGDLGLEFTPIHDQQLGRVTHHPVSGAMTSYPFEPVDGNGYAITRGFQSSAEFMQSLKPYEFDPRMFSEVTSGTDLRLWTAVPFQVDNAAQQAGLGASYLIFDQPVFTSYPAGDNRALMVNVDGFWMVNAAAQLALPPVKAALTYEAERFVYHKSNPYSPDVSRDTVENVPSLRQENVWSGGGWVEVPHEDGGSSFDKAGAIADGLLERQWVYAEGGYKLVWSPAQPASEFGVALSSMVDRVVIQSSAASGTFEQVDFASERERDNFEPERDLERRTVQATLFPGQLELRHQAENYEKIASVYKSGGPGFQNQLVKFLRGELQPGQVTGVVWYKPGFTAAGNILVGSALRGSKTSLATHHTQVTAADNVFLGVTTRHNESESEAIPVQASGLAYAQVQGPVSKNDAVGLSTPGSGTGGQTPVWLVKGGTPSVGIVQADSPAATAKLLPVLLGAGGGGAGLYRLKSVQDNYLTCKAWDGTEAGKTTSDAGPDVYIAKVHKLRHSITAETIENTAYDYAYGAGPATTPPLYWNLLRTARVHGTTDIVETCIVTPEWLFNDLIYAVAVTTGVFRGPGETNPVSLLMMADGREWAVWAQPNQ